MEAHRKPRRTQSDDHGGLPRRQPIPRDKQERLAVTLGKPAQGLTETTVAPAQRKNRRLRRLRETLAKPPAALTRTTLRRKHAARDSKQPGQRVAGDLVRPAPCNSEGLRRDLISDWHRGTTAREGEHSLVVLTEDRLHAVAIARIAQIESSLT